MKNLKIRVKILLSFGMIVALSAVFAVFVIISSLTTIKNVEIVRAEAKMQTLSANLMDRFSSAMMGANTISIKFDDNSYNDVVANIAECEDTLKKIDAHMLENPNLEQFRSEINNLSTSITAWGKNVDDIQNANKALEAIILDARNKQLALTGQSSGIFDYQMQLSKEEAGQELPEANRLRRVSRIETGMTVSSNLNYIGNSFEVMFKSFDTSRLDADNKVLADTIKILEDFLAESTLQYNIDTATSMLQALNTYGDSITSFVDTLSQRDNMVRVSETSGSQALSDVDSLLSNVENSTSSYADETINSATRSLAVVIIFAVVALVMATVLSLYISGIISKPLKFLEQVLNSIASTGQTILDEKVTRTGNAYATQRDEIGGIAHSVGGIIGMLSEKVKTLEAVAEGDLTVDIAHRSEHDTIANALQKMSGSLNSMFSEIGSASNQVSTGAGQLAGASQSLAQGSVEQAASIQQMTSSISEVTSNIARNADMAKEASSLSGVIKQNAEKGSRQMDQMMQAVKEINEASNSIGKVIKVIDDIAFQTNILALNAAVEAARAGQHGKGFAVVADEVRSLAAKSAEAAKDTSGLISNSIEKAQTGFRLATETSASLQDIVEGIDKSAELVERIARSSDEQAGSIAEIDRGISQVAQVVQQNSATAEESAAASEEMSSQSAMLQQLITRFKIKDSVGSHVQPFSPASVRLPDETGFSMSGSKY